MILRACAFRVLEAGSARRYVPHQPRVGGMGELKRFVNLKGSPKIQKHLVFDLACAAADSRATPCTFRTIAAAVSFFSKP